MIGHFLLGCIFSGFMVVTGHFFKFWKATGDPFFFLFAMAFFLFGLEQLYVLFVGVETPSYIYILRLVASCLILIAIVQKNRQ
jgi:hypothetical protein